VSQKVVVVVVLLLIIGWVINILTLFPLPFDDVRQLEEGRQTLGEIIAYKAKLKGRTLNQADLDAAIDSQINKEGTKAWTAWAFRVTAIVIGILGGLAYLRHKRGRWLWVVIAGAVANFVLWILPFAAEGQEGLVAFRTFTVFIVNSGSLRLLVEFAILSVLLPFLEVVGLVIMFRQAIHSLRPSVQ
jgi:hypothetical protein